MITQENPSSHHTHSPLSVLVVDDEIESLKLLGVLDKFSIPYHQVPHSERSTRLKDSDYGLAPILYSTSSKAELFWGSLLFLDEELWNGRLQFENPEEKAQLFAMIEECDLKIFPVIIDETLKESRGKSPQVTLKQNRVSRLLQWFSLSVQQKERAAVTINRHNLKLSTKTLDEAIAHLKQLESESSLSEFYNRIFLGVIHGVLQGCLPNT